MKGARVTDTLIDRPSDAELIAAVRGGDIDAYGELFDRHRGAALRLATQLVRGPQADDLVSEAFIKVLGVLQHGGGPDEAFRAYLLTSVRRLHIDSLRASARVTPTADEAELDRHVEFVDPSAMAFERSAATDAFGSLPERWQLVLWHLDVEGHKPADIAPLLGLSPNSVSALAYRAREGLRQAYLQQHLAPSTDDACRWTIGRLGAHVRHGLAVRDTTKVEAHLDTCARCTGLYLELRDVNGDLGVILGPALLGTVAGSYLGAGSLGVGASAIGAGSVAGMGLSAQLVVLEAARAASAPARFVLGAGTGAVPAVAATIAVAALVTAGVVATTTDFGQAAGSTENEQTGRQESPPAETEPAETEPSAPVQPDEPTAAAPGETGPTEADAPEIGTPEEDPAHEDPHDEPGTVPARGDAEPHVAQPMPVPTDFGIGPISIADDDTPLQRRITIALTAQTPGLAADRAVSVRLDFAQHITFRGTPSPGWTCHTARGAVVTSLTCNTVVSAGRTGSLVVKVLGVRPSATVTLTAEADPAPANDMGSFRAGPWLLLL